MSNTDREQYERLGRRWVEAEARAAYEATAPANWQGVFWTAVAAKLQRTHDAVYKQLAIRWGWPAKLSTKLERATHKVCGRCGATKAVDTSTVCRSCYQAERRATLAQRRAEP